MSKKSRVGQSGFFFFLLSTKPEIVIPGSGIRFRYLIFENSGRMTVVSKSGNPGPGPVPNSYFLYYIFIKAFILIKFEHNAYNYVF